MPLKNTVVDKQSKEDLRFRSITDQAELIEINSIIQNRKDTPLDRYEDLNDVIERINSERKEVK
ncbi:MAG: hypothetical protein J0647_05590 [Campylobacteraceae bacterium]|nr:hypothetical protein [Campylobacteraceae bacterium]